MTTQRAEVLEAALAILERDRLRERNAITRKNGAVSVTAERVAVDVRYAFYRAQVQERIEAQDDTGAGT